MMLCYEHAKAGETRDAVAVCANCGAALCLDHLVVEPEPVPLTNRMKRKMYCNVCTEIRKD